jgi:hypothetical protein
MTRPDRRAAWTAAWLLVLGAAGFAAAAEPIRLHPENPHYFLFRGRPTVLVTSGEHYGAVLNRDFDYKTYFKTLASYGFNLTRTFSGAYCEPPGAFKIRDNTLAPAKGRLICPWARSQAPGYTGGGNKFDLNQWDPEYFRRLRDVVAEAGRRGIVVELVLFCPFYGDAMWDLSPMNAANNAGGIGRTGRTGVYTLGDPRLTEVQDAMVRKIISELAGFDNVYYEICNEPYFGGVTLDWQAHIARSIVEAERKLGVKHLIAQNIANKSKKIERPDPHVSIFNFHYAAPPTAVEINYHLNKAIGDDETGFRGRQPEPYRIEGWEFILAGGAVYDNLDYSFTCGHEDGSAHSDAPGGGGPEIQRQLKNLKDFIHGFDFVRMKPDNSVIKKVSGDAAGAHALVEPGRQYAVYVRCSDPADAMVQAEIVLELPAGTYQAEWIDTKTGTVDKTERFQHRGGDKTLASPQYTEDIALRVKRRRPGR